MTANTTWIRRVAAGAVLVAASALIALGTATASYADTNANANATHRISPSYAPTPTGAQYYGGDCLNPYGTYQNCNARQ
jgi:hypothetical protein